MMSAKSTICDCYECGKETNSDILFKYHQTESLTDDDKKTTDTIEHLYFAVKCKGCDYVSFIYEAKLTLDGEITTIKETYPNSLVDEEDSFSFLTPEEKRTLPQIVRNLYDEVEGAFSTDIPILTGIGLRALLESICLNQQIKGKNLMEKIDNLHKEGWVSGKELPVLHNLREIGNITAHEIKKPSQKVLDYSLEILNHTLKSLYVIPRLHAKIRRVNLAKRSK